jgi:hypothetical protein
MIACFPTLKTDRGCIPAQTYTDEQIDDVKTQKSVREVCQEDNENP